MDLTQLKKELGFELDDDYQDDMLLTYIASAKDFLEGAGVIDLDSPRAYNAMTIYIRSLYDGIPLPPIFTSIMTQIKNEIDS